MTRDEHDQFEDDVAAICESFGLLADVKIELDRTDGARDAHLERTERR